MKTIAEKSLVLFTDSYPFGKSETFLESEIPVLAKCFPHIYIFPQNHQDNARPVPDNVTIISPLEKKNYDRKKVLSRDLPMFLQLLIGELKFANYSLKKIKDIASLTLRNIHQSYGIEDWLSTRQADNFIFYSYWFDTWATILAILKKKGIIPSFVSRAHRFDIYEFRRENEHIPYRKFQLDNIEKLILISQDGLDYIRSKYPEYSEKYTLKRLGTNDHGLASLNKSTKNIIHLISISNLTPVKRVHLIVEILKNVKRNVKWTHFGDGILREQIENNSRMLSENITCEFKGKVANSEVLGFLKHKNIDFFINVSESEGIPVSIMEAISFGIPVIATDSGGTREIVNEITGKLIPVNFKPEEISTVINDFPESIVAAGKQEEIRNFWEKNFNAELNYLNFCNFLKNELFTY